MTYALCVIIGFILGGGAVLGAIYTGYHFGWWAAKGSNPSRTFLREYKSGVPRE